MKMMALTATSVTMANLSAYNRLLMCLCLARVYLQFDNLFIYSLHFHWPYIELARQVRVFDASNQ